MNESEINSRIHIYVYIILYTSIINWIIHTHDVFYAKGFTKHIQS